MIIECCIKRRLQLAIGLNTPCCTDFYQVLRFPEMFIVRSENNRHAVCGSLDRIVYADPKSAADIGYLSESIDRRE